MKKLFIMLILGIMCMISYSTEVIKGIEWNMSKSEVKRVLNDKKMNQEEENELSYKNIQITDERIVLDQMLDLVSFRFKNNKLYSINGIITRVRNKDNIPLFTDVMKKCMTNEGSVEVKVTSDNMRNVMNRKYYYGCGLSYTQELMDLFVIYYNPADFK